MPYSNLEQVPDQWKEHKGATLTLEQINKLAEIYDSLKEQGADNPAAMAWTNWEKKHELKEGVWVKKVEQQKLFSEDDPPKDIPPVLGELPDVEIMSTGTWKGIKFTAADFDNMVENFNKLGIKVPLKLGHDDKQKFANRSGMPALGWVTKLARKGEKLVADISKIPEKLMQCIGTAYGRFSSEVWKNYRVNGNSYGNVLVGLALLGEEVPAVNTIDDLIGLYSAELGTYSEGWQEGDVVTINCSEKEDEDMDKVAEMEKQLEEQKAQIAKLSADNEASEKARQELENELKAQENKKIRDEIYLSIDNAIKDMKVAPAAREVFAAIALKAAGQLEGGKHLFSVEGKEQEMQAEDIAGLINQFSAALKPAMQKEEKATEPGEKKAVDVVESHGIKYFTDDEIHEKVVTIQKEDGCTYVEAFNKYQASTRS